jgi:hypothetical protein
MSSASRSRLIAVLGIALAAMVLLLFAAVSTPSSAMLAAAPAHLTAAVPEHPHLQSIAKPAQPEITARSLARTQSEEVGGSPSAGADDVPVQAYVNKVERMRALRAARVAAVHRIHEHDSFIGAINAGKLLDQFE